MTKYLTKIEPKAEIKEEVKEESIEVKVETIKIENEETLPTENKEPPPLPSTIEGNGIFSCKDGFKLNCWGFSKINYFIEPNLIEYVE